MNLLKEGLIILGSEYHIFGELMLLPITCYTVGGTPPFPPDPPPGGGWLGVRSGWTMGMAATLAA